MKKFTIPTVALFVLTILAGAYVSILVVKSWGEPYYYDRTFDVTMTAIPCNTGDGRSGRLIRRRSCFLENVGNSYDVYMATWPITYADILQGDVVTANGGTWRNEYWIYKSTWWVIAIYSTTTVHYRESE